MSWRSCLQISGLYALVVQRGDGAAEMQRDAPEKARLLAARLSRSKGGEFTQEDVG